MTNKEAVIRVLKDYGCSTSKEIAVLALRDYQVSMTPASAAGAIRPLISAGLAANSKDASGRIKYWLTDKNWDETRLASIVGRRV